jgi:hypothetical protein
MKGGKMVEDGKLLAKIDEGKREFLRKLSLAAAYATPVMASFSLDSVRKTAEAQGVYGGAAVLSVVFIPGGRAGGFIVSRLAQQVEESYGTIRVTYSKPMETSLNTCKKVTGHECQGDVICSKIDVISVVNCPEPPSVDLSDGWAWPNSTTEEKEVFTEVQRISLELNTPGLGCSPGARYRARDGGLLDPFADDIDTSEYCPGSEEPPIIDSKIDALHIW